MNSTDTPAGAITAAAEAVETSPLLRGIDLTGWANTIATVALEAAMPHLRKALIGAEVASLDIRPGDRVVCPSGEELPVGEVADLCGLLRDRLRALLQIPDDVPVVMAAPGTGITSERDSGARIAAQEQLARDMLDGQVQVGKWRDMLDGDGRG